MRMYEKVRYDECVNSFFFKKKVTSKLLFPFATFCKPHSPLTCNYACVGVRTHNGSTELHLSLHLFIFHRSLSLCHERRLRVKVKVKVKVPPTTGH